MLRTERIAQQCCAAGFEFGATATFSYGTFSSNTVSGVGQPPLVDGDLFASDSINVSSSTPGIIDVWVSSVAYSDQQVGYPVPQGNTLLESSFTVNLIPTGWTVQISTYFDESTSPYGTGQLLATQLFTPQSDSSATFFTPVNAIPAYSLTERYTIFASGSGSVEASAHLLAVLGPTVGGGPFGLIVTALIGLIGLARRKPHATA